MDPMIQDDNTCTIESNEFALWVSCKAKLHMTILKSVFVVIFFFKNSTCYHGYTGIILEGALCYKAQIFSKKAPSSGRYRPFL